MGEKVECPICDNTFFIHGFEIDADCRRCGATFKAQRNKVNNG